MKKIIIFVCLATLLVGCGQTTGNGKENTENGNDTATVAVR